ncbi:hypothetical protein HIR68_00355 [Staphylococcus coagulans]|uniref:YpoC family protein n=1 Tax=Staphylococcus coagulans TaxID=74706 RepID=UPI001BE7B34B|nr:hypothetical protein [Staphylococcus coagulans]MBT2858826.1 hypothetical protein [Staphylococcus coagulans]
MEQLNQMTSLEKELDQFAKTRQIGSEQAKPLLDHYYALLMDYFYVINQVEPASLAQLDLDSLTIVPFNIVDRLAYIEERKHHYMGYQQMKTLKSELIKMHAAYRARHHIE